jgi:hypothetical protein
MEYRKTFLHKTELLPIGTNVAVGNKRGVVIKAVFVKDQFGQPVVLHTINYTKILTDRYRMTFKNINKISTCNYGFIQPELI